MNTDKHRWVRIMDEEETAREALANHEFQKTQQITKAYLFLSCHPNQNPRYLLIPMKVKKS